MRQDTEIENFTEETQTGKKKEFPHYLKTQLEAPIPDLRLAPEIKNLPEEIGEKFGIPVELSLLIMLGFTSAHIGGGLRLGSAGDFGLPANLRITACISGPRNLNLLFRTVGKLIFDAERDFLNARIRYGDKPLPNETRFSYENKYKQSMPEERTKEFIHTLAEGMHTMARHEKPHIIFDQGSPSELTEQLAGSSDSGIFMLSDQALPLQDYLANYTAAERSDFLTVMRQSATLSPIKKRGNKNKSWNYSADPLASVLWLADYSTLFESLADERMKDSGFWSEFICFEVEDLNELQTYRPGFTLKSLPEWQKSMNETFFKRKSATNLIEPVEEAEQMFLSFEKELTQLISAVEPNLKPFIAHWVITAQKLAVNLQLASYGGDYKLFPESAEAGIALSRWLGARTLHLQHRAARSQSKQGKFKAEETMLMKIRNKGAVDFRNLCRSYRKQSKDLHSPVLESLLNKGLIRIGEDDLIRAAA